MKKSNDQLMMYLLYPCKGFQENTEIMVCFTFPATLTTERYYTNKNIYLA